MAGLVVVSLLTAGLVGLGVAVGVVIRSAWALLFPPILTVLWFAGSALFAEPNPEVTARSAMLSAFIMVLVPVTIGTLVGAILHRRKLM